MKTFYRSHTIEVNAQPNGQVIFDIHRGKHHLLAGFAQSGQEREILQDMKLRVDQLIQESPVVFSL